MQDILLSFGLIILCGVLFRRLRVGGLDPGSVRLAINSSVLNIFLPALCLIIIYRAKLDMELLLVPATAWITLLSVLTLAIIVYSLIGRRAGLRDAEKGVLILAAAFGNVTYLGLPVLMELYGHEAAKYALFYDLFASTPIVWLVGASLASMYGEGKRFEFSSAARTIVSLPPIWGILAGMVLNLAAVPLPPFVARSLDMLGSLVVPLMIFSIGLSLELPRVRHACVIVPAIVIKLAVSPFIAYTAADVLGLGGKALASCAIEGAMPAMVLSLIFAERFKLDIPLAAFVILVTTMLSFFTLPAVFHIVAH